MPPSLPALEVCTLPRNALRTEDHLVMVRMTQNPTSMAEEYFLYQQHQESRAKVTLENVSGLAGIANG